MKSDFFQQNDFTILRFLLGYICRVRDQFIYLKNKYVSTDDVHWKRDGDGDGDGDGDILTPPQITVEL